MHSSKRRFIPPPNMFIIPRDWLLAFFFLEKVNSYLQTEQSALFVNLSSHSQINNHLL